MILFLPVVGERIIKCFPDVLCADKGRQWDQPFPGDTVLVINGPKKIFVVCTNTAILSPWFSVDRTSGRGGSVVCQKYQANYDDGMPLPFMS